MALAVPESMTIGETGEPLHELDEALASLLEFTGAAAGWIGLRDAAGRLTFPVRRGDFPESWLHVQQSRGGVWGFAVREGPTLLNDLRPWAALGEAPLLNLLSCPLSAGEEVLGHVALVNKPAGFASQDAAVLQGMAHHMVRRLRHEQVRPRSAAELPAAWRHILDRAAEGILVLDDSGALLYANATWLEWTGFRTEDLLGRLAPFPFWVSQHDLVRAMSMAAAVPASALPFRRRDQSLFWCQIETVTESWEGRPITVAFLQQTTALAPTAREAEQAATPPPTVPELPQPVSTPTPGWLPLLLEEGGGIDGWGPIWEKLTGLSARDVQGSRTELVLDWLFPQQHDRERVADCFHQPAPAGRQLLLDVTTPSGSRPLLCTFLPLPVIESSAGPRRRWLLLVGESERSNKNASSV